MPSAPPQPLPLLRPGDPFPPLAMAWPARSEAPGLLAMGGALDVATLVDAYAHGVFPWYSDGEPLLWWSPDPRMVLAPSQFRLHRSLRKVIERFRVSGACEIRMNTRFAEVISACASAPRDGQTGTWIGTDMIAAYQDLHAAGHAYSVETWIRGELVAGLYGVSVGRAVFGESMFTRVTDGSKIALAALVCFCRARGLPLIDCQQNTAHLASLGAAPVARGDFVRAIAGLVDQPAPAWHFDPVYWTFL